MIYYWNSNPKPSLNLDSYTNTGTGLHMSSEVFLCKLGYTYETL